jgi:cytoskeletal protein RodZ
VSRLSTIGETLRSAREEQGKSIAEAATATRIRSSYLEALEQERFDELGGSVYAKGFLRSYASFLGLDPQPMVEAYRANEPSDRPAFERPPKILGTMQARRRSPSWVTIGIVAAAVVLGVGVYSLVRPTSGPAQPAPAPIAAPTTTIAPSVAQATTTTLPPIKGVKLELHYRAVCWTKVTADGKVVFQGILGTTPTTKTFTAKQSMDLVLGAAGSVDVTVNGKPFKLPANSGQVLQHHFTASASAAAAPVAAGHGGTTLH